MLRRLAIAAVLLFAITASPAAACPMCKLGNDADTKSNSVEAVEAANRAKAYTISIFFMMSMPPIVLGGLTLAIRREIRKAQARQAAGQAASLS